MYEKAFSLEIITPTRVVFRDEATSLSAPGVLGRFQILYDHAPFLTAIGIGELKVKDKSGNDTIYATSGGFVEVSANKVVVLADAVEKASEIDVARAQAARTRAQERLHHPGPDIDVERARAALARALNRLRIHDKAT
ncbi:MAG TPA: F0F1 ATP synthase subunit epsilon [Bacteroidota bacterium]|nr:F0F1 ATP synthase subunit epsilon [Bacteroidota bacterium]